MVRIEIMSLHYRIFSMNIRKLQCLKMIKVLVIERVNVPGVTLMERVDTGRSSEICGSLHWSLLMCLNSETRKKKL